MFLYLFFEVYLTPVTLKIMSETCRMDPTKFVAGNNNSYACDQYQPIVRWIWNDKGLLKLADIGHMVQYINSRIKVRVWILGLFGY